VLFSVCVCLCLLVGPVWVFCVVDLLFFSGVGLNGGCGLLETHGGRLKTVSDFQLRPFSLVVVICYLLFVICYLYFSWLLCFFSSLLCCDCGCGRIVDGVVVAVGFVLDLVFFRSSG